MGARGAGAPERGERGAGSVFVVGGISEGQRILPGPAGLRLLDAPPGH